MSHHSVPPLARTSSLAVWSLVCGLLSPFCLGPFTALPAVILGHLALSSIDLAEGRLEGRSPAIVGLVLGYIVLALFAVLVAAAFLLPMFSGFSRRQPPLAIQADLVEVHAAIKAFYREYGRYPGETAATSDITFDRGNAAVLAPLRGPHAENLKGIVFYRGRPPSAGTSAAFDAAGNLCDAWGRPYFIRLDTDHDGQVDNPYADFSGEPVLQESVLVWSLGADGAPGRGGSGDPAADYLSW